MAKDKMNIPQIRFKGFEGEWASNKIIDMADYVDYRGKTPTKTTSGILLITAKNIKKGFLDYEASQEFISKDEFMEVMRRGKAKIGDVLITTEAPLGNVATIDREDIALAQRVIKYRGKKNILDNTFLKYRFLTFSFQKKLESMATGGTVQGIKGATLHRLPILVSKNLQEQIQIGDFFQKIDQIIELQQQKVEQSERYKKAMLQKMFPQKGEKVPRVRFAGFSGDWEENRLKEVISSEFKGKAQLSKLKNGDVEYLDAERLNGGMPYLSNAELDVDYKDILILWDGSKAGTVYKGFQGALGSTLKAYKIMKKHSSEFIYQSLKYRQAEIFEKYRTPNIPHVIKDFTELFKIKLPSLEEQTQIGNFFEILDQQIEQQAQKLATYQQLKKAMLQRMFV